jgi:DNA polymerase-3 subunit beta
MKIICDGLDLADAISTVSRAISSRASNPVLEGIKIVAKGKTVTLSATDLDIYLQKTIRADVKVDGSAVVPGRLFGDYIRKLTSQQISLTSEGSSIIINHGDSVCNFQCLAIAEYPDIISLSSAPSFSIKSEALRDFIAKTVIFAGMDDSRPVLKGVLCELNKNQLTGVALDGFRLAHVTKDATNLKNDLKIVVPARSMEEVKKLLSDDNGEVNVIVENKFFQVNIDGTTFAARLIDGEFINYKQIIPTTFESNIMVEKSAFESAVERAGLLVRGDKINLITLKLADKQIGIISNNEIGKIAEKMPASLTGKDITICFNAKYLFDALRSTSDEYIKLSFNNEVSPCVITSAKEGDYLFLILPVRLN